MLRRLRRALIRLLMPWHHPAAEAQATRHIERTHRRLDRAVAELRQLDLAARRTR